MVTNTIEFSIIPEKNHKENRRAVEETPAARRALPVHMAQLGLIATWTEKHRTSEGAFFLENIQQQRASDNNKFHIH